MKVITLLAFLVFSLTLVSMRSNPVPASAQGGKTPPETIVLAKEAKLGPVAFNHMKHITENRSPDGARKIECIECHHTKLGYATGHW